MTDSPPETADLGSDRPAETLVRRVVALESEVADLRARLRGFEQGRQRASQRALMFRLLLLLLLLVGYFVMRERYAGGLG
ncbi:MAG TPA: hypothetical protein VF989_05990 [Polyangiaceae bacterium]|jgi:hypothetical protein